MQASGAQTRPADSDTAHNDVQNEESNSHT